MHYVESPLLFEAIRCLYVCQGKRSKGTKATFTYGDMHSKILVTLDYVLRTTGKNSLVRTRETAGLNVKLLTAWETTINFDGRRIVK